MRHLVLLFSCSLALNIAFSQGIPTTTKTAPVIASTEHWEDFTSMPGQFKVRVPGPFKEKADIFQTDIGILVYHTFFYQDQSEGAENFIYMISYVDYPSGAVHSDSTDLIDEFFQATIDQATFSIAGDLAYSNPIKEQGYPGFLWRINYRQNTSVIKTKAFLKDNRYYAIQAVTAKDLALNPTIDRFMDSFKLLE